MRDVDTGKVRFIGSRVPHKPAQTRAQPNLLVVELLPVNTIPATAVTVNDVAALAHEAFDNAVARHSFVVELLATRLAFAAAFT